MEILILQREIVKNFIEPTVTHNLRPNFILYLEIQELGRKYFYILCDCQNETDLNS